MKHWQDAIALFERLGDVAYAGEASRSGSTPGSAASWSRPCRATRPRCAATTTATSVAVPRCYDQAKASHEWPDSREQALAELAALLARCAEMDR